jgi:hypothetical protein
MHEVAPEGTCMQSTRFGLGIMLASLTALSAATMVSAVPASAGARNPDTLAPRISRTYCGHDVWSISTTPAAGFSPLRATAAELNANNYPLRPALSNARAYAQWKRFVASPAATRSSCAGLHPGGRRGSSLPASAVRARPAGQTQASDSQNWTGNVVHNNTYSDVEADWTLPFASGVSGTNDYSSSWVGIGLGDSSQFPLMQAGSESDWLNGTQHYYLWIEVFPQQSEVIKDGAVSGGDSVGAHVTYTTAGPKFHIWDLTRNFNGDYQTPGSWSNDGHAEWIYERPRQGNGKLPYLADAAATFTQAQATVSGTQFPLGQLPHVALDMYNCPETQQIAGALGISANGLSFATQYLHHGDQNQC